MSWARATDPEVEPGSFTIRGPVNAWIHTDDLQNTMALSDGAGALLEFVEYADYGDPQLFNAAGAPIAASLAGNPGLFCVWIWIRSHP